MPDLTLCATEDCPLAGGCYRKLAPHGRWQSVSRFDGGMDCAYFLPAEEGDSSAAVRSDLPDRLDGLLRQIRVSS